MKLLFIYIASPYNIGDKLTNVKKSLEAANILMDKGFVPYAPLLNHFQDEIFPRPEKDWIEFDIHWLYKCDAVLRLPGESKGADEEVLIAKKIRIPVFYSIEELVKWSKRQ
ncbi:MAG: DUF4406 domain-containing protein [Candidatus Omnitrophica bacterium]|nr:DUF4406 domain-containing protein [Candidatus Omnitrophota bacterium]